MYFTLPATMDELKAQYRGLVKINHPDIGGDTAVMQQINAEYDLVIRGEYRATAGDNYSRATEEVHANIINIVQQIVTLAGIEIEICGTWVWISGNSFPVKDTLKSLGFKFSGSKKMWYYTEQVLTSKYHRTTEMNTIRAVYGSQKVETKKAVQIG